MSTAANVPKRVIIPGDDGKPQRVMTQPPASSGSVEEETGVNVRATTGPGAAIARLWRWLTTTETTRPPTWFSRPLWPHVVAFCGLVGIFVTIGVVR